MATMKLTDRGREQAARLARSHPQHGLPAATALNRMVQLEEWFAPRLAGLQAAETGVDVVVYAEEQDWKRSLFWKLAACADMTSAERWVLDHLEVAGGEA